MNPRDKSPRSGAGSDPDSFPLRRQAGVTSWEIVALLLIVLLAAILRFYRLPEVPPGLHFDEGFKGVTARGLLAGDPPRVFFESDMGEEPVAIYLVAAAIGLVGHEPWVIRLPSAIVGTLTIPLVWWLGREVCQRSSAALSRQRGRSPWPATSDSSTTENGQSFPDLFKGPIVALGTALILAILHWHLCFSRIGMEPILVPFFATLAMAALARGLNTGRWPAFALAGLALGGSLYTYKAGYFVPVVAVLFIGLAAILEGRFLRRHGRGLLLTALVALLVSAPMAVYSITHLENFLQRPASVALLGGGATPGSSWRSVGGNLPRVLGMFFLQGDVNPRSNLPGRPALDPFLALLFLVGVGQAALESLRRRSMSVLPPLWLGVMILPTLMTEYAPHFGRAIGATPALALLCALGGWTLWRATAVLGQRWIEVGVLLLLAGGMITSGICTARAYFVTWGRSPDLFYAYDVGLVEVAAYINGLPSDQDAYLTPTSAQHYTLQYLVRRPLATFDGRAGLVLPAAGRAATTVVLLREDDVTLPALQALRPDGQVSWTTVDSFGAPYAVAYQLPTVEGDARVAPSPDHPVDATFHAASGRVRLLGYSLAAEQFAPGDRVDLILYWQALTALGEDYTVFTHLLGDHNPETGSPWWAGHDSEPDGGHYPTTSWQPGQTILDVHTFIVPANAPPGDYQLEAGLYLLATMTRLPAMGADGQPLPDQAVVLGTIRVGD